MKRKLEKKEKIKAIFLPFLVLLLLFVIFFIIDIGLGYFETKEKLKKYDEKRTEEILKMVNFINKKYNINVSFDNCIYYREEDYNKHTDFLGNGYDSNIPYIGLFEYNDEKFDNNYITDFFIEGKTSVNEKETEKLNTLLTYIRRK